jgi:hypothetical protein
MHSSAADISVSDVTLCHRDYDCRLAENVWNIHWPIGKYSKFCTKLIEVYLRNVSNNS